MSKSVAEVYGKVFPNVCLPKFVENCGFNKSGIIISEVFFFSDEFVTKVGARPGSLLNRGSPPWTYKKVSLVKSPF